MKERHKSKALEAARTEGLKRLEPLAAALRKNNTTSAAKYTREELVEIVECAIRATPARDGGYTDYKCIAVHVSQALEQAGALQVKE